MDGLTYGRTDRNFRPTLLGRLRRVDLKIVSIAESLQKRQNTFTPKF